MATSVGAPKTLTATYNGDVNFNGSSDTTTHTVNRANTTTAVASSVTPSMFGQASHPDRHGRGERPRPAHADRHGALP